MVQAFQDIQLPGPVERAGVVPVPFQAWTRSHPDRDSRVPPAPQADARSSQSSPRQ